MRFVQQIEFSRKIRQDVHRSNERLDVKRAGGTRTAASRKRFLSERISGEVCRSYQGPAFAQPVDLCMELFDEIHVHISTNLIHLSRPGWYPRHVASSRWPFFLEMIV